MKDQTEKSKKELGKNIIAGSLATSTAVGLFNSLDTIRIRYQTLDNSKLNVLNYSKQIIKTDGFYKGLARPGLFVNMSAVAVSSGTRLGLYPYVRDLVVEYSNSDEKQAHHMVFSGFLLGSFSFWLSTPLFKAKILAQSNINSSNTLRNLYNNGSLYKGSSALIVRGSLLSAGSVLGYDGAKTLFKQYGIMEDGVKLHIVAGISSAFFSTLFSNPADYVLTRYTTGNFTSLPACIKHIYQTQGLVGFYRGYTAFFFRVVPVYFVNYPIYELLRVGLGLDYMN